MGLLGARLTYIGVGRVNIELPTRPGVTQQHGYIHAGATSAIADGYAALTLFPDDNEGQGIPDEGGPRRSRAACRSDPPGWVLRSR